MHKNEKGFAYPISLCILVLMSMLVILESQQYLSEKRLAHETETILKQEYYFLLAARRLEGMLQREEMPESSGVLSFHDANVTYVKEDLGPTLKISFTLILSSGERAVGFIYYDKTLKKMVKWVEKN
jgi:hypothetical protein